MGVVSDLKHEPHAVRWARRYLKAAFTYDWTRWHWTNDASFTLCGVPVPISLSGGTFFPETDEDPGMVSCTHCLRKLS